MSAERTRLTHKIAIQLHLVTKSCAICISRSKRPVRKLLDTPSYSVGSYFIYLPGNQLFCDSVVILAPSNRLYLLPSNRTCALPYRPLHISHP